MNAILLKNATVFNEGKSFVADVLIQDEIIQKVEANITPSGDVTVVDLDGKWILPGCIDDQVHFREPGLTHKGNIFSESRAAVAGGITSFMEMPNTVPNALTQELLQDKYDIAAKNSPANYSFFMGASNDNIEEVLKTALEHDPYTFIPTTPWALKEKKVAKKKAKPTESENIVL